jgi:hypothetical protein
MAVSMAWNWRFESRLRNAASDTKTGWHRCGRFPESVSCDCLKGCRQSKALGQVLRHRGADEWCPGRAKSGIGIDSIECKRTTRRVIVHLRPSVCPRCVRMAAEWSSPSWRRSAGGAMPGRRPPAVEQLFAALLRGPFFGWGLAFGFARHIGASVAVISDLCLWYRAGIALNLMSVDSCERSDRHRRPSTCSPSAPAEAPCVPEAQNPERSARLLRWAPESRRVAGSLPGTARIRGRRTDSGSWFNILSQASNESLRRR